MYKSIEDVQTLLAERISQDKLQTRPDGFTYVPWEVTARQLDTVFGPFGWSETITHQQHDTERGVYIVSRQIIGYAMADDEEVTIVREGVGTGQGDPSNGRATDTAIKAADSDSFSRAAKKLGDAFGLYLYDKTEQQTRPASRPAATGTVTRTSGGPSEKQMAVFAKNGYSEAQVATLPNWRETLDGIFAQRNSRTAVAVDDSIPF